MDDNNKKGEWSITLPIAGYNFGVKIDPANEEIVRKAAKEVNLRFGSVMKQWSHESKEKCLARIAYEYALKCVRYENKNDTEPYTEKIKELTEMLEAYFRES